MKSQVLRLFAIPLLLVARTFAVEAQPGALVITNNEAYDSGTKVDAKNAASEYRTSGSLADSGTAATLHLANGDHLAGELRPCGEAGILRWQGSSFAAPLDFYLGAVSTVSFPAHGPRPHPDAPYSLELEGGDVLFGALAGLSNNEIGFDVPGLGLLHVQRSAVQRIVHSRRGADLVYLGPNSLLEWKQSPSSAWQQEAGRPSTTQEGASIFGDLGLPKQSCIDFEISWSSDPDFTWVLGARADAEQENNAMRGGVRIRDLRAGPNAPPEESAFRVEVFAGHLVLICETAQKGDLISLQKIAPGAGRCHLQIYVDQERNRAIAFSADGKLLADLTVGDAPARGDTRATRSITEKLLAAVSPADAAPVPGTCLRLTNHHGNVRLEQLSIRRWDGRPPTTLQGESSRLVRSNGLVLNGHIEGFDASTKEFMVSAENGQTSRVPADAVDSIVMPSSVHQSTYDVRAICASGIRLSGKLLKVADGRLWLNRAGIAEPLAIAFSSLHSLVVLDNRAPPSKSNGRNGRLEGDGLMLHGCLAEAGRLPGAGCLAWRPRGSVSASPLKQDFAGRIVYRDLPPSSKSPQMNQMAQGQFVAAAPQVAPVFIMGGFINLAQNNPQPHRSAWNGSALYLRTGDTIQCEIKRIDERGVTFHSRQFDASFVPNEKIKAVELEDSRATKIDMSKRDRLLTLPRMQKDDPPTHLIRSIDGDYLRGRLIDLDDKTLTVEVRLDTRHLPRDQIASIIWLDKSGKKDKADPPKDPAYGVQTAAAAKPSPDNRVQSLRRDGVRMTFRPDKLTGTILQGTSDVLGACRVELSEVDQLIIGRAIEREAQALPYQRWTLQPAIEPKFAQASNGGAGMESELVGKPAPDFELETLDGRRFRLSEQRKKIVVVDFWATWCGPCRQTLPELVRAVAKYEGRNVVLLTVNLQESPEAIKAMLALLELKMAVGLDRNGAVAEKYAAVAIPQTVIIDGNGNVARLFVGGGPQYFDQVTQALEALTAPAHP
jgi:thiol-disulfide isomerase/thioredoxin